MGNDKQLPRRSILSSISATAIGSGIATVTTAQDYDRPRTVVENGVEFTKWDCTRIIVDTNRDDLAEVWVQVQYIAEYWREELDTTTHMERVTATYYGDELDINTHRRVPIEGAYAGADRLSWTIIRDVTAVDQYGTEIASVEWPIEEWNCISMMEETIGEI
ncbi:uncharacterized protein Nmag_3788 (plasmid) [Natrialba magadii ATCC 43099]|uniref:Uncharacterized protein n=1 Tax=Natrialba magadii (strain ATCC 43099 / DSM 3394 / CCM 3739 / CIP 104546 / IAM 13178 / JCM 8861 / NBRC 102185 / NCIMB 2190 / MS3) TaxID=547559 RepID=D3T170_NATMM|nr:uncharacterized protein Nmag_3788 [Natrialba magadii ATCC 43099]